VSDELRKLNDILFVCVLRYGLTRDKRFALAALVTYQHLLGSSRRDALENVERKIRELRINLLGAVAGRTGAEQRNVILAVFIRSAGLVETLRGQRGDRSYSLRSSEGLNRIAPELARAIESHDVHAVNDFGSPRSEFDGGANSIDGRDTRFVALNLKQAAGAAVQISAAVLPLARSLPNVG
jgi:hypothetical protein